MMRAIFWDMAHFTVMEIYLRSSELLINSCKEARRSIPEESTLDMLESKQISFIIITHDRTLTNTRSSSTRKPKEINQKEFHYQKHRTKQRKTKRQDNPPPEQKNNQKQQEKQQTRKHDHNQKVFHIQNTELNNAKQNGNPHHGITGIRKPSAKIHICICKAPENNTKLK
jgi:hypothetical protein